MAQPPVLYADLDRLLEPINLDSSNHLLDAILSNLQGLTPEQEAQKRQIEERARQIQAQTRATKSAGMPSLATTLRRPQGQADGADSSQVEHELDDLDTHLTESRLSQPLRAPEDNASKPPKAVPAPRLAGVDGLGQFQLDGQSKPLFPLTPPSQEQDQVESQSKGKAGSNYERLLQRHFGRTSASYGQRKTG